MEEDIKILKRIQENLLENIDMLELHKQEILKRKSQAIENILGRLEQLEKENKELKDRNLYLELENDSLCYGEDL